MSQPVNSLINLDFSQFEASNPTFFRQYLCRIGQLLEYSDLKNLVKTFLFSKQITQRPQSLEDRQAQLISFLEDQLGADQGTSSDQTDIALRTAKLIRFLQGSIHSHDTFVVRYLVQHPTFSRLSIEERGNALLGAMKSHNYAFAKALLEGKMNPVDAKEVTGQAFIWACKNGFEPLVEFLLTQSNFTEKAKDDGYIEACNSGQLAIVIKLTDHVSSWTQGQGFQKACYSGHLEIIQLLMPCQDEKNIGNGFVFSCIGGNITGIELLINHPLLNDEGRGRAFESVCRQGNLTVVEKLMKEGQVPQGYFQVGFRDGNTKPALVKLLMHDSRLDRDSFRMAFYNGYKYAPEVAILLMNHESQYDFDRRDAFVYACKNLHINLIEALLTHSDIRQNDVETELSKAQAIFDEIAKELAEAESYIKSQNLNRKETPIQHLETKAQAYLELVKVLQTHLNSCPPNLALL